MPPSAKDAVVIILDIGCSDPHSNNDEIDFLKKSKECASMVVQRKIFAQGRSEVALILMGSKISHNTLYDGCNYCNINVIFQLEEPTWNIVQKLQSIQADACKGANWQEAVVVALDIIRKGEQSSKGFLEKKIILFTNNFGSESSDAAAMMEFGIQDLRVSFFFIHPTVDEADIDSDNRLSHTKELVEKVQGSVFDIEDATVELSSFQKKKVKARAWNICMDTGSKINIAVSGYKKINDSQKISWTDCIALNRRTNLTQESGYQSISTLKATPVEERPIVKEEIEKEVINVLPNQTKVEKTEVISGYYFGSTLVPFTGEDENQMKYVSGSKCLSIVKITKQVYVPRYFWMGKTSYYFVARDNDECAAVAFSAFVQALNKLESVAIVRRVYSDRCAPRMGALFPYIKPEKEYLVYVELPFGNDLRQCALPELKVDHLSSAQLDAVDQLIDGMDLSSPVEEDSGEEVKDNVTYREWNLLEPHHVSDPYLQHMKRCIAHRALNPAAPLPEIDSKVKKLFTQAPESIIGEISGTLERIRDLFPNLGMIEPPKKKKSWKRGASSKAENSVESEESSTAMKRIKQDDTEEEDPAVGMLNPIEDFTAAIQSEALPKTKVCKQMEDVILNLVINSFGKEDYDKPKDSLKLLRSTIMNDDTSKSDLILSYNCWMQKVYEQAREEFKMGFWNLIAREKLAFITSAECPESDLHEAEISGMYEDATKTGQTMSDEEELDLDDMLTDI